MVDDPWRAQLEAFGSFVRTQRQLAKLSLRELAELATVSNPYLSQIERGLHEPSIRVIRAIANALDISTETLLAQVGLVGDNDSEGRVHGATEAAIGWLPRTADLELRGLDVSADRLAGLLTVDAALWRKEVADMREYLGRYGSRLPAALLAELDSIERRLP